MNDLWKWLGEQLGTILGVVSLITGVWFYILSRKPKRFGWELISKTRISSKISPAIPLTVVYDGLEVDSPNIVVVRVGNTGKAELRAVDFDGPVKLEFTRSRLLSASVSKKLDESITADFVQAANTISFTPPLFNAGDWVEFQLVTDGELEVPSVHARVAGQVGRILDVDKRKRAWEPWAVAGMLIATGAPLGSQLFGDTENGIIIAVVVCGFLLFLFTKAQQRFRPTWRKTPRARRSRAVKQMV